MTREDIIRMALEAGSWETDTSELVTDDINLEHFAALVAAAEREEFAVHAVDIARRAIAEEREAKDAAYKERNQLVALLSTCFPAGKAKTAIEGWDEAWHGCVYIDFPWGQASWHYHDSDAWMFEHLPQYLGEWDGHTTQEKYDAIATAIQARGNT